MVRTQMREVIGDAHPRQIFEFGEKIADKLKREDEAKTAARERSGKISGGKLGQPTLWAVLDIIGVPRKWDPYMLGKFKRGNDVEKRAIEFLTGIDTDNTPDGEWVTASEGSILQGEFMLQKQSGYRGGTGYVDLTQKTSRVIYHEIKSLTKMAYDKVAATGRSRGGVAEPYYHHAIQLAYYCIGDNVEQGFLHGFNADDYRLVTFSINPWDYKEEIDREIDDIQSVFLSKQLPAFEGFLDYHKAYKKNTFGEWNDLKPEQMLDKLRLQFPEQYKKFMEITI